MSPKNRCKYIDHCPMYHYFNRIEQAVFREMVCEGHYDLCVRYKLQAAGLIAPHQHAPNGNTPEPFPWLPERGQQ